METPYSRLLNKIKKFSEELKLAHTANMFAISKQDLGKSYGFQDIWERTMAAQQIGYEVVIKADLEGIHINYRKTVSVPTMWW